MLEPFTIAELNEEVIRGLTGIGRVCDGASILSEVLDSFRNGGSTSAKGVFYVQL